MEKNLSEVETPNVKNRVMEKIRAKKVHMRHPLVFIAEKLGLESVLVMTIILGALLVNIIFYLLKKSGALGIENFFTNLPFDYLALFIITLILAIYLANKIELFCGSCEKTDYFAVYFFLITIILGFLFAFMGVGDFLMQ